MDEVVAYSQTVAGVTKRYYPHYNHLYSVAALTDGTTGAVVERYTYDAYGKQKITDASGNVTRAKSSVGWDRGFTGYVADNETGLLHARARQYSPTLGRFVGRDSFVRSRLGPNSMDGYNDGFQLYQAYFIPNGLDPSGLIKDCCRPNAKKENCYYVFTYKRGSPTSSMVMGHSAFGLSPTDGYGFHSAGYEHDIDSGNGTMEKKTNGASDYPLKSVYKCCCLTDDEMNKMKDKIEKIKEKIKNGDKTDSDGQGYDAVGPVLRAQQSMDPYVAMGNLLRKNPISDPWTSGEKPFPSCSGSAADFGNGMGCGPLRRIQGISPMTLESTIGNNDYCEKVQ